MSDLIKVTGLWKSTDKNGKTVLSGNLNSSARIVIFENNYKDEHENAPDFELFITKNEKQE